MEKEYLFSGKRVDNGEWVYGCLIFDYITGQCFIHSKGESVNESDKVNEEGCLSFFAFEINPETIREYTNLMDCEFNKIFNGDLLQGENGTIWLMTWSNGWWSYQIVSQNTKIQNHCTIQPYTHTDKGDYIPGLKIIGNKFDNPELLKD